MKYRIWCLTAISTLLLGTAISVQAQWAPVIAKQKEVTYRLEENGSKVILAERRGDYYRSSSGSIMDTWRYLVDGQEVGPARATFLNASTGKRYSINHRLQRVRLVHQSSTPILPQRIHLEETVGESVINGVECVGLRVLVNGRPTKGVSWVSVPYDLDVKVEFPMPNGQWVVRELYDIQLNEPDPSKFKFPSDYTIDQSECRGCDNSPPELDPTRK